MFKVPCLTSRLYARHTSWRTGFGCSCWWDLWRKWTWLLSARPRSLQLDGLRWSWVCDWLLEVNAVAAAAAAAAGVSDIRRRLQLAARGRSVAVVVRPARRRSIQRAVAGVNWARSTDRLEGHWPSACHDTPSRHSVVYHIEQLLFISKW